MARAFYTPLATTLDRYQFLLGVGFTVFIYLFIRLFILLEARLVSSGNVIIIIVVVLCDSFEVFRSVKLYWVGRGFDG